MAYTIKSGDTLSGIAKRNNTTVSDIMAANPNITNANKIRAGASLNLPGASSSARSAGSSMSSSTGSRSSSTGRSSGGSSRSTTYGNGSYGGKYLGSRQTNAYQSMENAPGSTGYEKGSLTLRVPRKDDDGEIYYEDVTKEGVLPLGTSFQATGSALADAANAPDSSGIFAYAKGRTPGYIQHASGYTGYGYQDAKGNFYDSNGNFIREDNFYYEPGAQISRNGMYQDTGSGMGHAGYGVWGVPGNYIAVQGSKYGNAPGTEVGFFGVGGGGSRESAAAASALASTPRAPAQTPTVEEVQQALGSTYMNDMSRFNNTANVLPGTYQTLREELNRLKQQGLL